ncbi:MAG: hypothetical protein ABXS92_07440 [Sulfurimonas sp.]
MSWKRYQNEMILLITFLLFLGAFFFKQVTISAQERQKFELSRSVDEIKEIIAFKKIWADKKVPKDLSRLKNIVDHAKLEWSQKGKKLNAHYRNLSAAELNKVVSRILNIAVEIEGLTVKKHEADYEVVLKCKW